MTRKQKPLTGLKIDVKNNNVEWALKKMKRMVKDSGMLVELRDRSYYEKPSEKRRKQRKERFK